MDTKKLFEELDRLLLDWGENKKLYYGGCCIASYFVADHLKTVGIPYSVVMYVDRKGKNLKYPDSICKNQACLHMAIAVDYEGEETILGVDENLENLLLTCTPVVRTFDNIYPKDLYHFSRQYEWIGEYDHENDQELWNEISKIFDKYL